MDKALDMIVKINCKNDKEVETAEKELNNFIRRIKHFKGKKIKYEASIMNLESGKFKTIINKKEPREINL